MDTKLQSFLDKVKDTASRTGRSVGRAADAAGKKASEMAAATRLNLRIFDLNTECDVLFLRHRHAYQTLAVHRHKVDVFCCGKFCRTDEIALILSVLIICDKYYFSCTKLIKCFFYCVEFHILCPRLSIVIL